MCCFLTGSAKQPAAKDVERQRSSFFQSLRRTSAKTLESDKAAHPSSPSTPPAQTAAPVNPPLDPTNNIPQPNTASANGVVSSEQNGITTDPITNGHDPERRHSWDASDPRSQVSAEEEAFLRSLGWTEAGDDEDGKPLCHLLCRKHIMLSAKAYCPALPCPALPCPALPCLQSCDMHHHASC